MTDKQLKVFFEVHSDNPREGPGSFQSTRQAYLAIRDLPPVPKILDIGCGPGAQTLHLAEISSGEITAVDNYSPFIELLSMKIKEKGLSKRVSARIADMNQLPFELNSFDVIWAEGSIYQIGVENGLKKWYPFLKQNGSIAYTEITWLKKDIPTELYKFWTEDYPAITNVEKNLEILEHSGYRLVNYFVLPETDWNEQYYSSIVSKLPGLREKYKNDMEALSVLDKEEEEINMYLRYSDYYGYVFYIAKRL